MCDNRGFLNIYDVLFGNETQTHMITMLVTHSENDRPSGFMATLDPDTQEWIIDNEPSWIHAGWGVKGMTYRGTVNRVKTIQREDTNG